MAQQTNSPEEIERLDREARARRQDYLNDMAWVLADERGRRVMLAIVERSGALGEVWAPGVDIHFRAARHDFGKSLEKDILAVNPETYTKMVIERFQKENPPEKKGPSK